MRFIVYPSDVVATAEPLDLDRSTSVDRVKAHFFDRLRRLGPVVPLGEHASVADLTALFAQPDTVLAYACRRPTARRVPESLRACRSAAGRRQHRAVGIRARRPVRAGYRITQSRLSAQRILRGHPGEVHDRAAAAGGGRWLVTARVLRCLLDVEQRAVVQALVDVGMLVPDER